MGEEPGYVCDLPTVDEISDGYIAFSTQRRRIDYSAALSQFLMAARAGEVRPIVVSGEHASLSPLLGLEMSRAGGAWVVKRDDGLVMNAFTGSQLTSFADVVERRHDKQLPLPVPELAETVAAIGFDVVVHHRATEELQVGLLAEVIFTSLNAQLPDVWGDVEPLMAKWDRAELTLQARAQMPVSSVFRASAPGAWCTLQYRRSPNGVTEQARGQVVVGDYAEGAKRGVEMSCAMLRTVHAHFTPIVAITGLADADPGGYQQVRSRRPEVPQAYLMGPWMVKEAKVDIDDVVANHRGERLGRALVASLLVPMSGPQAPWEQMSKLVHSIGVDNIAFALGLGKEPQRQG